MKFSSTTTKHLGHYVYGLVDPRDKTIFYVGKASANNRAFNHLRIHEGEERKHQRIREIHAAGYEPSVEILRYGLGSLRESFEVEAAVIDALGLENLTNKVRGHGVDRGRQTAAEVERLHGSKPMPVEQIRDRYMLFFINRVPDVFTYEDGARTLRLRSTVLVKSVTKAQNPIGRNWCSSVSKGARDCGKRCCSRLFHRGVVPGRHNFINPPCAKYARLLGVCGSAHQGSSACWSSPDERRQGSTCKPTWLWVFELSVTHNKRSETDLRTRSLRSLASTSQPQRYVVYELDK